MFPDIDALYIKNGVTRVTGLQIPKNGSNSGLARNPKSVTPKFNSKMGLQNTGVSVTPIQPCETGLQKQGYGATRMAVGLAGSVTHVTHVTPFFNRLPQTLENECEKSELIREFIKIDGLSLDDAKALAEQCQAPRPASEWLAMIAELDMLIEQVCTLDGFDMEARQLVQAARRQQSLASIPETLHWYRMEAKGRQL